MNIVVIGSTDLLGSRLVTTLREAGHEAMVAPPCGVDTAPGEGLAEVVEGADVVVDAVAGADAPQTPAFSALSTAVTVIASVAVRSHR